MQVNHENTKHLLSALEDLIDIRHVEITTDNKGYPGRPSDYDCVLLEKEKKISFEVFDKEIVVYFFDDHTHFYADFNEDYFQEAIDCLRLLFSQTLVKIETFRGRVRTRYEWFFLQKNGRKDSIAGPWLAPLFTFVNPFRRKTYRESRWKYHRGTETFIQVHDDVVSLHSYDWDIMIQICHANGTFFFYLVRYFFDEELGVYYWRPIELPGKSLFDTEKKAFQAAKEAAKLYCASHKTRSLFET